MTDQQQARITHPPAYGTALAFALSGFIFTLFNFVVPAAISVVGTLLFLWIERRTAQEDTNAN